VVVGASVVGGSILIVGCRQAVFRVLSFVLFLLLCSLGLEFVALVGSLNW
jgi:hypothetical protein